jgi:small ubiquitin-related modifier
LIRERKQVGSMQFVREIQGLDVEAITNFLSKSDTPFTHSHIYDGKRDEKVIDKNLRQSEFRLFTDKHVFGLGDKLLQELTESDKLNDYAIVRNDITHIVYKPGDFFSEHKDYLSMTSNVVEEYSLLVCVTPESEVPAVGGETLVNVNQSFTHSSTSTTTRGCGLLFRKDLVHESAVLQSGAKEIITLNVWMTKKNTGQILLVSFNEKGEETQRGSQGLQAIADAKNYALSMSVVHAVPGCFFAGYTSFNKSKYDTDQGDHLDQSVITYLCEQATYDEFAVVYKALTGAYVSYEEVSKGSALLDFFGVPLRNIIVDMANKGNEHASKGLLLPTGEFADLDETPRVGLGGEICCSFCSRATSQLPPQTSLHECSGCSNAVYCSSECMKMHWRAAHKDECSVPPTVAVADEKIIVCTSEERTAMLNATAKQLGLPYIPFRIFFVEGTLHFGGGMSDCPPVPLKMLPAWVSLGDYDNVYALRTIIGGNLHIESVLESYPLQGEGGPSSAWKAPDGLVAASKQLVSGGTLTFGGSTYGGGLDQLYGDQDPRVKTTISLSLDEDGHGSCGKDKPPWFLGLAIAPALSQCRTGHGKESRLVGGGITKFAIDAITKESGPLNHYGETQWRVLPKSTDRGTGRHNGGGAKHQQQEEEDEPEEEDEEEKYEQTQQEQQAQQVQMQESVQSGNQTFHLDADMKVCFTEAEAGRTCTLVKASNLVQEVQARIQTTKFELPQTETKSIDHSFCNEQVYGKMNLLMMTGMLHVPDVSPNIVALAVKQTREPTATIIIGVATKYETRDSEGTFFKVKMTTRMEKVFDAFAQRRGVSAHELRFWFGDQDIQDDQTPDSLGLKDQDRIEVTVRGRGGDRTATSAAVRLALGLAPATTPLTPPVSTTAQQAAVRLAPATTPPTPPVSTTATALEQYFRL